MKHHAALERTVPATLDAVDRLCAEMRGGFFQAVPAAERFAVELLLREALTNAVQHGVKGAAEGVVSCRVRMIRGGIEMCVADSGAGFDWRMRRAEASPPLAESGRGLAILERYSSSLRFNRKGNGVRVTRMFKQGEENAGI
jgi:anti-sigma regulatory factor (Ser/Thr protein kinase)